MLDFIVLGYIPGTTYQINLDGFFAVVTAMTALPAVLLIARALLRHYNQRTVGAKLLFVNLYRYNTLAK